MRVIPPGVSGRDLSEPKLAERARPVRAEAGGAGAKAKRGPRHCSICEGTGHDARGCPKRPTREKASARKVAKKRASKPAARRGIREASFSDQLDAKAAKLEADAAVLRAAAEVFRQ